MKLEFKRLMTRFNYTEFFPLHGRLSTGNVLEVPITDRADSTQEDDEDEGNVNGSWMMDYLRNH